MGRTPSGLFPSRTPPRPTYREPHQVRPGQLAAGLGAGAVWLAMFALLAGDLRGLGWWTIIAGAVAWLVAAVLARHGDRGVAAGLAVAVAVGWGITTTLVALRWAGMSNWPLW
ncbi:hypothetical protein AAFH96_15035 [Polymorphospora sp. 2-325]|uniref:DUF4190 domain-containing protein n=1 Tax=Polymorphospora lycopeni TaxID=3140240 RepID=A0ABV5CQY8_9ACTN